MTSSLPPYLRPGDDEPLDAVQQALVEMWVDIIADKIRADLAAKEQQQDQIGARAEDDTQTD